MLTFKCLHLTQRQGNQLAVFSLHNEVPAQHTSIVTVESLCCCIAHNSTIVGAQLVVGQVWWVVLWVNIGQADVQIL